MMSFCVSILLALSASTRAAPRDLDHIDHLHRREPFGRGLLRVSLPVPLALTQTRDSGDEARDIDNEIDDGDSVSDIKNIVSQEMSAELPRTTAATTSTPTPTANNRKTSTLPPLEWYYQFIERNAVDESNRGGNSFITFSCCHQIRRQ